MKTQTPSSSRSLLIGTAFASMAAFVAMPTSALAINSTWNGATSGTWSDTANWVGTTLPGSTGTATFNTSSANTTIDLGAGITVTSIIYDTASASAYTIGAGGVGAQTLNFVGGANTANSITMTSTVTQNQVVNANVGLGTTGTAVTISNASGANTLTIAGNMSAASSGTKLLTTTGTGTTIISGNISDGLGVVSMLAANAASGTTVLSGNNTFTGGVTVNRGALVINSNTALGTGTFTINSGAYLDSTANTEVTVASATPVLIKGSFTYIGTKNLALAGNITLNAASTVSVNANMLTFGGSVTGAYALTKSGSGTLAGSGTLVLAGANSYTGATSVNVGVLNLQNNSALGTGAGASTSGVTVSSTAALQLQGGISTTTAVALTLSGSGTPTSQNGALENVSGNNTYSGAITVSYASSIGSDAGTLTLTGGVSNAAGLTLVGAGGIDLSSSVVSGAGGVVINMKNGGSVTVGSANSYTGTTTVKNGTLVLAGNAPSGSAGSFGNASTAIALGDTAATGTASILTNGAYTIARSITETTGATNTSLVIGGSQTSGTSVYTGNITLKKDTTLWAAAGGEVDFTTNKISGAYNVIIDGGGTVGLAGANTFGGVGNSIAIQGGATLSAANSGNLGSTSNGVVFNDGTLKFGGVYDLSSRSVTVNSGGATFDTNGNNISFANGIGNNGTGGVTKTGNGTLTFSGVNTYSGATNVSGGTLAISGTGSVNNSSAINVNSGATLDVSGHTGTYAVVSGQTLNANGNVTGPIQINLGGFLKGSGTLSGATTVYGTLEPGNSIGTLSTADITLATGSIFSVELNRSGASAVSDNVSVTGAVSINGSELDLAVNGSLSNLQANDIFFLINNDGTDAIQGTFSLLNGVSTSLTQGSTFTWNSQEWEISYQANSTAGTFTGGNDLAIMAVPEPSTWAMLVGGIGMLAFGQRFRRRSENL